MSVEKNKSEGQPTSMSEAFSRAEGIGDARAEAHSGGQGRPQQNNTQNQQRSAQRRGIPNLNNTLRRPVARRSTGADVQAFVKALEKQLVDTMEPQYRDNYQLLVFDNQTHLTALSSILVVLTTQDKEQNNHAVVFNLVVESSGGRLNNTYLNIGQNTIEQETTAGDTVDQALWDKVVPFVQDSLGGSRINVHYAGAMVLPSTLVPTDETRMHEVFYVATQALFTVAENDLGTSQPPFSISLIEQSSLTVNVDTNTEPAQTATGLPVRDDQTITLRASLTPAGQTSASHEGIQDLTRVSTYVDLYPAAPRQQVFGAPPVTQRYYPIVWITRLDSMINAVTLEIALLGLASTTVMAKNGQWAAGFLQRYGSASVNALKDFGAVGYEVNLSPDPQAQPAKIDTRGEGYSQADLLKLIAATVYDEPTFMMYVDEVGELSWLHSTFLEAARGNPAAQKSIIDAANNLTNGAFGQNWHGGQICFDNQTRSATGYYIDSDGVQRDLRDIDTLAMLNLFGGQDMGLVKEYTDTFLRREIPSPMRLETRNRMLRNVLRGEVKIKGYAQSITFDNAFLQALIGSAIQAGLAIRQNNTFFNLTGQAGRATFDGSQFGLNGAAAGNLFTFGGPSYGNYRSGPAAMNRWNV